MLGKKLISKNALEKTGKAALVSEISLYKINIERIVQRLWIYSWRAYAGAFLKGAGMFKLSNLYSEDMALAVVIWFCTLPLVAFIVVPMFGSRVAIVTSLTLLVVIMAACWVVCGWKLIKEPKGKDLRSMPMFFISRISEE